VSSHKGSIRATRPVQVQVLCFSFHTLAQVRGGSGSTDDQLPDNVSVGRKLRSENRWKETKWGLWRPFQVACIGTSCDSGTSTLETYYSNFIDKQLYAQQLFVTWWVTGRVYIDIQVTMIEQATNSTKIILTEQNGTREVIHTCLVSDSIIMESWYIPAWWVTHNGVMIHTCLVSDS